MILTKLVLKTLKSKIDGLGYTNFLYIAPQSTSYPFITYFPVSNGVEYTFGQVLEDVNIQLSMFNDGADVAVLLDIAQELEGTFDELSATDGEYTVYCTHRTNESGPLFLTKENYWQLDMDLVFKCERNKV